MSIQKIILTIIIFGYLIMVVSAETYITYVDDVLGFYKVRDITTPTSKFVYENRVLTIDQGDTIIWENDATKTSFSIVSEQNLWDDKVGYLRVGSKLNYKFDKPGKYTFYVKDHKSIRQTVIVNMIDDYSTPTTNVPTPVNTPVPTMSYDVTPTPTMTSTILVPIKSAENDTEYPIQFSGIKLPIKMSLTTVVSIVVALLSIIIMYKVGRNKR